MTLPTAKEAKKKADRVTRVKRTAAQFGIVALLAVYPTFLNVTDWSALKAALPTIGFVALGAIVTDVYNRVKPA